jgi:hypothetical protein
VGTIELEIVIGGPTTSTDIVQVAFDLVFDGDVLRFVPPAIEGPFLSEGGSTTLLAGVSPTDPGRLIVAASLIGGGSGVQGAAPGELVVALTLRAVSVGSTPVAFDNAEVVDSDGAPSGVQFRGPASVVVDVATPDGTAGVMGPGSLSGR